MTCLPIVKRTKGKLTSHYKQTSVTLIATYFSITKKKEIKRFKTFICTSLGSLSYSKFSVS